MIARKSTLKRLAGGAVVAVIGSGLVFGLMVVMNGLHEPPEKPDFEQEASFQVQQDPDPPERPDREPEPEQQSNASPEPPAPPPNLNSSIGTVDFDMPGFSPDEVDESSRELVGDVEASTMTADSVDEQPKPSRRVDPKLPRRIVEKQLEGRVVVKALVDEKGRVQKVRIVSSEPKGVFEPHVREAVKQWQFQPARYEGEPVKTWIELPFEFELG